MARWLNRRMHPIRLKKPVVTFTFDDFPRSALLVAGTMLRNHGFYGTYYTSFGLMDKTAPTGEIFKRSDLPEFIRQGHELACHTFDHCHSWDTAPDVYEASIRANQRAAAELLDGLKMNHFSYPISHPRPETKRRVSSHYQTARGGGQAHNSGETDLNFLKAFFLEQSRDDFAAIQGVIDANARANGWLIFATHDVCAEPTRYGCTPELFKKTLQSSIVSGAEILTINQAMNRLHPANAMGPDKPVNRDAGKPALR